MNFNNNMNDIQNERNFDKYLEMIEKIKKETLIFLVVKDSLRLLENKYIEIFRKVGFERITNKHQILYVGVLNKGNNIFDCCGKEKKSSVVLDTHIYDLHICVESHSEKAIMKICDKDYSSTYRGLNILVYNFKKKEVEDLCYYDPLTNKPQFFHRTLNPLEYDFDKKFYILNRYKTQFNEAYNRRYFSNKELQVKEAVNGIIEPMKDGKGGVCDSEFNFLAGLEKHSKNGFRQISDCYRLSDENIEFHDEVVVYGGALNNHPGHMIIENFATRLWWIVEHPEITHKIAVTIDWGGYKKPFVEEFLRLINIPKERLLIVDKPMQFKKIIIPDQCLTLISATRPYEYTFEYKKVFDVIRDKYKDIHDVEKSSKIYLTSKNTYRKNVIGENWFINFYKNRGFKIINPADYSTEDKVIILGNASEVVSQAGTNILWTIFCKKNTKITILSRTKTIGSGGVCHRMIFECANISDYKFVDVSGNILGEDFTFGLSAMYVTDLFKKYVKEEFDEIVDISCEDSLKNVIWEYLQYYPKYLRRSDAFDAYKDKRLVEILQNMSEVICKCDFDKKGLDLSTNEDILRNQLKKQATLDNNTLDNNLTNLYNKKLLIEKEYAKLKYEFETKIIDVQNEIDLLNM